MKAIGLTLTALTLGALSAGAGIIAYESFDYITGAASSVNTVGASITDANANSMNGGYGWTDTWQDYRAFGTGIGNVLSGSFGFSDGSNSVVSDGNSFQLSSFRGIARQVGGGSLASGTYYFSFVLNRNADDTNETFIRLTGSLNQNDRLLTLKQQGTDQLQYRIGGGASVSIGTLAAQNNFVMAKFDYDGSANLSNLSIWLNPTDLTTEANNTALVSGLSGSGSSIGYVLLQRDGGGNSARLDEIRLATSWSDAVTAVPEPATYAALLGALALGGVLWRRRRG
jgi:hypothetical protein